MSFENCTLSFPIDSKQVVELKNLKGGEKLLNNNYDKIIIAGMSIVCNLKKNKKHVHYTSNQGVLNSGTNQITCVNSRRENFTATIHQEII